MISIGNGLFFLLKRIPKTRYPHLSLFYFCVKECMYWSQQDCKSILLTQCVEIWSCGTGTIQMFLPPFCSISTPFGCLFFSLLVGKEATTTTFRFLHLFFAFRLHQSSSPSSSNMHVPPWNLDSLEFACENADFLLLKAYLCFFHLSRLSQKLHFFNPLPTPPPQKKRKRENKKERQRWKSMVHGGDESTTWLMMCPNPRQRKCSCSAKTQIWRLCSRKPRSWRLELSSCLQGELIWLLITHLVKRGVWSGVKLM